MTLRIISGAGLVPVESPTDGPTVDLSQDPRRDHKWLRRATAPAGRTDPDASRLDSAATGSERATRPPGQSWA